MERRLRCRQQYSPILLCPSGFIFKRCIVNALVKDLLGGREVGAEMEITEKLGVDYLEIITPPFKKIQALDGRKKLQSVTFEIDEIKMMIIFMETKLPYIPRGEFKAAVYLLNLMLTKALEEYGIFRKIEDVGGRGPSTSNISFVLD